MITKMSFTLNAVFERKRGLGMKPTKIRNRVAVPTIIADVVTETLAKVITNKYFDEINMDNKNPREILNTYEDEYNKNYRLYEKKIHDMILDNDNE